MRILHFGDAHYEEAKHRKTAADGIDQGWHDVAAAVDQIVDRAIELAKSETVVVAFGGDLARTRKPSPQTYEHFGSAVARLAQCGIPVIAVPGNHDIASNGEANALDPLSVIPSFHLFNEPEVVYIGSNIEEGTWVGQDDVGARAAIVCMPWLSQSVAAQNLEGLGLAERLNAMSHAALAIIRDLAAEPISNGIPTFLLYHGTVQGGLTPTGQMAHLFHEPVLGAVELDQIGFAAVMLNHLHKRQQLPAGTPMWYSSSVERLNFGDEHDDKGALEWSVPEDGEKSIVTPVDTNARRFVTVTSVDDYGHTNFVHSVYSDGDELDVDHAIVRVRITSEPDPDDNWQVDELTKAFMNAGAHAVAEVVIDEPERGVAHEAMDVARHSPLEALKAWLLTEHPDDDQYRDAVLARAVSLDDSTTLEIPTPEAIPA